MNLPLRPLLPFLIAAGCGAPVEPADRGTSTSAGPLYAVAGKLWSTRDVPVCWRQEDANEYVTERTWVRNALSGQRSWTDRANVVLTGWGLCPQDEIIDYGIEITPGLGLQTSYLTSPLPVADMLLDFNAMVHMTRDRCSDNNLTRKECIEATALHELGHAVGFDHEHSRPDSPCQPRDDISDPAGDTLFGPYDAKSIMGYCEPTFDLSGTDRVGVERLYGPGNAAARRLADYNGDGRADIACHNSAGNMSFDYAGPMPSYYAGVDLAQLGTWCSASDHDRVFTGDFNGDGRADLLCFNSATGSRSVDLASDTGTFGSQDSHTASAWCAATDTRRLLIGDVDGDGRDDLVCHDHVTGALYVDLASNAGTFAGTNWSNVGASLCNDGDRQQLFIGDFDGDGRADLYCHDFETGAQRIDYTGVGGALGASTWTANASWCDGTETRTILVGDFNGDGNDDLLCHDARTGQRFVDHANESGTFLGDNWSSSNAWCSGNASRAFTGDVDSDGHDDLVCVDVSTGARQVAFASASGTFVSKHWNTATAFCNAGGVTAL